MSRGGGLSDVSTKRSEDIWKELCIHDDGIIGHGGTNCLVLGSQGSGKTTIATYMVHKFHYTPDVKKDLVWSGYGKGLYPETVLYAGAKQDYWNIFIENRFEKCFPDQVLKPMRVFTHKEDKWTFFERGSSGDVDITDQVNVFEYRDQDELMNNLLVGGLNIIYSPSYYVLSMHLKDVLNERMMLGPDDVRFYDYDKEVSVPPFVFIYELLEFIYSTRGTHRARQWYSFILDECHKYFPYGVKAPLWHLVDWLADMLADTRRANLSLYGFTHSLRILDFRVVPRFNYFIWLPGSKPDPEHSRVHPNLIMALSRWNQESRSKNLRWAISERKRETFGRFSFSDIKNRPPLLVGRCDSALHRKFTEKGFTRPRCPQCNSGDIYTRRDGTSRCKTCRNIWNSVTIPQEEE